MRVSLIRSRPVLALGKKTNAIGAVHCLVLVAGLNNCGLLFGQKMAIDGPHPNFFSTYVGKGQDSVALRRNLLKTAEREAETLAESFGLTNEQRAKVKLAAKGDVYRLLVEIDQAREDTKHLDLRNPAQLHAGMQRVQPIQERLSKPLLNDESLAKKVCKGLLTADQLAVEEAQRAERALAVHEAIAKATIADLERLMPLTRAQRVSLLELIEYPKKSEQHTLPFLGKALLARIDDAKLAKLLDEQQLKVFKAFIEDTPHGRLDIQW